MALGPPQEMPGAWWGWQPGMVTLGELATEAGQQQNAFFGAGRHGHAAAATTPPFQRDPAPAKPCPGQDRHLLPGAATTLHGRAGTSADPSSRIAAVTVRT